MTRVLILLFAMVLASGCATHGQDRHFERNASLDTATKLEAPDPQFATVYLIRPRAFAQAFVYTTIPPIFYAVDGRLVSIMPVGTYVRLKLAPGAHTFSSLYHFPGGPFASAKITQADVRLVLEPGKRYYVSESWGFPDFEFKQVDDKQGPEKLAGVELAKTLYAPATIEEFKSRLLPRPGENQPVARVNVQDALPSQQQVSNFFEGLATIALVALLVAGAVAGASVDHQAPSLQRHVERSQLLDPPAYYQPQGPNRWSIRTSSGVVTEVSTTGGETEFRNWSTGVKYTIEGDRIRGSDGSRYSVRGSSIVSDTGQEFKKIGSSIFGSDGRSCDVIGAQILCRPPR